HKGDGGAGDLFFPFVRSVVSAVRVTFESAGQRDGPGPRLRVAIHTAHRPPDSRTARVFGRPSMRLPDGENPGPRADSDRLLRRTAIGIFRGGAVLLARGVRSKRTNSRYLLWYAINGILSRRQSRSGRRTRMRPGGDRGQRR